MFDEALLVLFCLFNSRSALAFLVASLHSLTMFLLILPSDLSCFAHTVNSFLPPKFFQQQLAHPGRFLASSA